MNGVSLSEIQDAIIAFTDMEKLVDQHNEEFIARAMVREKKS